MGPLPPCASRCGVWRAAAISVDNQQGARAGVGLGMACCHRPPPLCACAPLSVGRVSCISHRQCRCVAASLDVRGVGNGERRWPWARVLKVCDGARARSPGCSCAWGFEWDIVCNTHVGLVCCVYRSVGPLAESGRLSDGPPGPPRPNDTIRSGRPLHATAPQPCRGPRVIRCSRVHPIPMHTGARSSPVAAPCHRLSIGSRSLRVIRMGSSSSRTGLGHRHHHVVQGILRRLSRAGAS